MSEGGGEPFLSFFKRGDEYVSGRKIGKGRSLIIPTRHLPRLNVQGVLPSYSRPVSVSGRRARCMSPSSPLRHGRVGG